MSFTINAQGELCVVQKAGGTPLYPEKIIECMHDAARKVKELDALIKSNLEKDAQRRKSKQPISKATTPASYIKQEKWEEIYKKDQEEKSTSENMEIEKEEKKNKDKDVKMEKVKEIKKASNTNAQLFSGGKSTWDGKFTI